MTEDELRKECTTMWHKIYYSSTTREQDVESLVALCKRMQEVGAHDERERWVKKFPSASPPQERGY